MKTLDTDLQGGPKLDYFNSSADNLATVTPRTDCYVKMFWNLVNKNRTWIAVRLNIVCLICTNLHHP